MEKVKKYRQFVQEILSEIAGYNVANQKTADEFETQLIFDKEHDHYQLLSLGWEGYKRTFGVSIHFDIKNGKIWIQQNLTEIDLAEELVKRGVPKEDIVLGLHSPSMRKYTDFAVI
jgi:XisI protein